MCGCFAFYCLCRGSIHVSFQLVEYCLYWVWMDGESMSRRIKLEIYLDVLGTIKSGVEKPTSIMSRANLSWRPLQSILGHLLSEGLVDEIDMTGVRGRDKRTSRCYRLTRRGEVAFRYFSDARDLLSPERLLVRN